VLTLLAFIPREFGGKKLRCTEQRDRDEPPNTPTNSTSQKPYATTERSIRVVASQGRFELRKTSIDNPLADISLQLDVSVGEEVDLPTLAGYIKRNSDGFGSIYRELVCCAPLIQRGTER
jgi:hypothetical protein